MPEMLPKWDPAATRDLYANKFFLSRDSYITFADAEGICHFVLEGPDRAWVREWVLERSKHKCEAKRHHPDCSGRAEEMDHVQGGNSGRCDCLHHGRKRGNLRMVSRACHHQKHNRNIQLGTIPAGEIPGTGEPKYVNPTVANRGSGTDSADDDAA